MYELRVYHAATGKLESLVARFRDYTDQLFAKHGMKSLAYWTAVDEPAKSSTFVYILEHPSREAATANWKAFQEDPEWKSVKAKSEAHGRLVDKIDSTFLTLTDFSPTPRIALAVRFRGFAGDSPCFRHKMICKRDTFLTGRSERFTIFTRLSQLDVPSPQLHLLRFGVHRCAIW